MAEVIQTLNANLILVLASCVGILWLTFGLLYHDETKQQTVGGGLILAPFMALLLVPFVAALTILIFLVKTIWAIV